MVNINSKYYDVDTTLENGGCNVPAELDARVRAAAYIAVEFKLHHEQLFALELERKSLLTDLTSLTEQYCVAVSQHQKQGDNATTTTSTSTRTRGVKSERCEGGGAVVGVSPPIIAALGKKIHDIEQSIEANLSKKAALWETWVEV